MEYDVAVAGGGPAGLMAAKTAARSGLNVVVIEKREQVSPITRACCEQFILDADYSGETIHVKPGKVVFTRNEFEICYDGPLKPVTDKYYVSPGGRVIHFAHPDGAPVVMKFDKGHLLRGLWGECEQAGVAFRAGTVAYDAKDNGRNVELSVSRAGVHDTIRARKLIVADGANSGVSEALGMNRGRTCYATALCMMYYMEGIEGFDPAAMKTYFGRAYKGLAPIMIGPAIESDSVGYVICTGNRQYPPPQIFENVTNNGALAPAFRKARLVKKTGCSIKTYAPMPVPWRGNTVVIGDAAAYVEVETQGAIMCGFRAGSGVAAEIEERGGFDEYTRWWKESFEFLGADFMRVAQGFVLVPTYTDDELDYLFGLIETERLEGTYNQYRSPRIMWEAILRHREQIERERPEVYEKITNSKACISDML